MSAAGAGAPRGERPAGAHLIVRYVAFAAIATAANLGTQEAVVRILTEARLAAAILAGTAVGFLVKHALDKLLIFLDPVGRPLEEARKAALSGLFSVATTLVFWAFELAFWIVWGTAFAKYTGAVIGLALGYAAKYRLDKAYIYRDAPA